VIERGQIYWVDLGDAIGSRPAKKRRPVLVIQGQAYNQSRLATVIVAAITSNTALAAMPGNVFLPALSSGLKRDSVVNVTALITLNKVNLDGPVGTVSADLLDAIDSGLRRVLSL
jgi:mRNA interferase MazF